MQARRLLLSVLAITLVCGLVAVPAGAATPVDKKQNKALKALNKRTKKAGKKINKVAVRLGKVSGDLGNIQAAVPTVLASLTQLADAAKQLKAGLETVGAGLTKLGDSFTKYVTGAEYGVVGVYVDGALAPGAILTSSDIPDDSNGATVTGTVLAAVPNGAVDAEVTLRAAIRSGERDGTAQTGAAGLAGLVSMTVAAPAGLGMTVTGGNTPASVPLTSAPNAAVGGAPLYPIALKAPRVDATPNPFAFPEAQSIDLTDVATLQPIGAAPAVYEVDNPGPAPAPVLVTFTVRFHDLVASATDLDE
jgi:hypothetical protein